MKIPKHVRELMRAKRPAPEAKPVSKYRSCKTAVDGIVFDSKKESERYSELKLLQSCGQISNLRTQVSYPIVVNGIKVCRYVADFVYEEGGKEVVEDTKSRFTRTNAVYRLKRQLMLAVHGISILES